MPNTAPPLRFVILAHPQLPLAMTKSGEIAAYLRARGLHATAGKLYDEDLVQGIENNAFDMAIAMGGDGTMLRCGHLCAPHSVPIFGINMGRLGFLTEVNAEQWQMAVDRLVNGQYWLEARMMLRAELFRSGKSLGHWDVLNEAMVGRGHIMRPVHLTTSVDSRFLTTYVADGLIAATPTGSTAYALAAGGPILPPDLRNILLVPVAPHLSIDRAIVLAEGSFVSIRVSTDHAAALSVDGQPPVDMLDGDQVDVRANENQAHFVRFKDPAYFYRNLTSRMNTNATGASS